MPVEFVPYGQPYPDLDPDHFSLDEAKKTLLLCQKSSDFEVVELGWLNAAAGKADIIIVDCVNPEVPTHNSAGIKVRERLALVFVQNAMPDVKALRRDFPITLHLVVGNPPSLCLYFESWDIAERSWTPQKHLQRILWWLSGTANGSLHPSDQPVDHIFFAGAAELVLPPDFDDKIKNKDYLFDLIRIERVLGDSKIIRGSFIVKGNSKKEPPHFVPLFFSSKPIIHGAPEFPPPTLGELHKKLHQRGDNFIETLREEIRNKTTGGVSKVAGQQCLIILQIPIKRSEDAEVERYDHHGYLIAQDLATLGENIGLLVNPGRQAGGKFFAFGEIIGAAQPAEEKWQEIDIFPMDTKLSPTTHAANLASVIDKEKAQFNGVLAGVGALGSNLADTWGKEGWGRWSYVDPDYIKPHNVLRHIARDDHIGYFKVDAVAAMIRANYHLGYYEVTPIAASITDKQNAAVKNALDKSALLVDVTTTLSVPRELSQRADMCRSASAFITPSGIHSVLLIEDKERALRLDSLEAQYYHSIINSPWGETHLSKHLGNMWVGAGCRDITLVIPYELIQLHAAILARQTRLLSQLPEAAIRIWSAEQQTGEITIIAPPVFETIRTNAGTWQIVWDNCIEEKLRQIRNEHLPSETGGIIVGYIDQKIKAIYVVDVLPPPPDSDANESGFTRGIEGVDIAIDEIGKRTAHIVGYIGEWHSHPAAVSAMPSKMDVILLNTLAGALLGDGHPALMIIVAEDAISLIVKEDEI